MLSRCKICPCCRNRSPVPSSGPSPCRLLLLLEAPHKVEDSTGIPASGPTGQELNDGYLPIPGLFRDQVHVYNAVCCSQPSYRNPTPEEALICSSHHLPSLLDRVQPEVVMTMGAVAASLFPGISLPLHHGIPRPAEFAGRKFVLIPSYHPTAGMHSTAYMIPLRNDFLALKHLLQALDRGEFSWPTDPHPNPDYRIARTPGDLDDYLRTVPGDYHFELGTDTEFFGPHQTPYCLTLSHTPGTGRLVYSANEALLKIYAEWLRAKNPLLLFHNYLADCGPYAQMRLPIARFRDTMIRAYELAIGGGGDDEDDGAARGALGLKILAYRHLHMTMGSFKDLVTPHTIPHVIDWLIQAQDLVESPPEKPTCICGHPQESHSPKGKSGRRIANCTYCSCQKFCRRTVPKPDKSIGSLTRKLKTLSRELLDGQNVDPWNRFEGWHSHEQALLEDFLGPMPVRDIRLVPENELLGYAVADSDATLRLHRYLNTVRIRPW